MYVPPGAYTIGTIQLKDHVTLEIEGGATLFLLLARPVANGIAGKVAVAAVPVGVVGVAV